MNEKDRFVFGKHGVGSARQRLMERVPKTLSVEKLTDVKFGARILFTNRGHHATALRWCYSVGHNQRPLINRSRSNDQTLLCAVSKTFAGMIRVFAD